MADSNRDSTQGSVRDLLTLRLHATRMRQPSRVLFTVGVLRYVVPANPQWYRKWAAYRILIETREDLNWPIPTHTGTCAP